MDSKPVDKVVILARGLGTRMMAHNGTTSLDAQQEAAADTGVKAMIPIKRPFLDYVLSTLADAGYKKVCLVIGPEHSRIRDYYEKELQTKRLDICFAVQPEPLGTADAVLAAEDFADGEDFVALNSDNYYPLEALQALRNLNGAGAAMFSRESLLANSNILPERVRSSAVAHISEEGYLHDILEKPDEQTLNSLPEPIYVSKNCWRFTAKIFEACRKIEKSPRGEFELPDAVRYAVEELGEQFRIVAAQGMVLDLSYRSDIGEVTRRLENVPVNL